MRHHWKTQDKRFGVTHTFWDFCFGTQAKEDQAKEDQIKKTR
jgi:sterol desaturase/sphingolipid hydroxylase (fatty acid hydroxylase superfamily)